MPFNLGIGEIMVVLVVALLVFGGRLPEVGRSLGRSIVEFKQGLKTLPGVEDEIESEPDEGPDEPPTPDPSP
jgi:sec-independent protein translocase protein TatA